VSVVRCLLCGVTFLRPETYLHPTHRCCRSTTPPAAAQPIAGGAR
jgi:hypothetical protein